MKPMLTLVAFVVVAACPIAAGHPVAGESPQVDFKKFEDDWYKHGLANFRKIRAARPKDTFYSFGFFTTGEFGYVATTASTKEGLDQIARQYKGKERYKTQSLDDLKLELKWSPCDSPLHTN